MKIAIYSRKSKFTGKGDSIENQIDMCKEYAEKHFDNIEKFIIYEDEGFSGGDTDRPEFQRLIEDAKKKKFNMLICYRLDRISRNVSDFSNTIEELNNHSISFISIREQFDTSTPMGRAMMYIASVFAQLERETIAERIRDNMLALAKTGRWLGGVTPTGFESTEVIYTDPSGKERKMFKLTPINNEIAVVKIIFDKFLELKSLTKLETYCLQNNIKSKNGIDYTRFALRNILTNPVYAIADNMMYDYLIKNNLEIYADKNDFNGANGVIAYNKTIQKKNTSNKQRDPSEWIISVGAHVGIIDSEKWIKVQRIISRNKSKSFRKVKNTESLLSGLLRCAQCDNFMRPRTGRTNKKGIRIFYYMCEMKEKSKRTRCNVKNINGNKLDKLIIEEIKKLSSSQSKLSDKITKDKINIDNTQNSLIAEIKLLETNIENNKQAIDNLVNTLSQGENTNAAKYIINQINILDEQTGKMKKKLQELREKASYNDNKKDNLDIMKDLLVAFSNTVDTLSVQEKRNLLKSIVEKISWDGEKIDIVLFGTDAEKKH